MLPQQDVGRTGRGNRPNLNLGPGCEIVYVVRVVPCSWSRYGTAISGTILIRVLGTHGQLDLPLSL